LKTKLKTIELNTFKRLRNCSKYPDLIKNPKMLLF